MRLLISAYACAPNRGSEHAVGWNWITEAHRLGHQVCAVVAPNHREAVTLYCRDRPDLAGIVWRFPEVAGWPLQQGVEPEWERTYNLLWQISATAAAMKLNAEARFDVVHHLTWGGVRAPTFLGVLGAPLIVGPLGGGETSPRGLRDAFHLKARITETVRDLSNGTITFNPIVRHGLSKAAVIYAKTPETVGILSKSMQRKSRIYLELGLDKERPPRPARSEGPPRLLFAGRLLYWKGAHIAIETLAQVRRTLPEARLTLVGRGKEEARLRALAATFDVAGHVDFTPWLPQAELFELYRTHDLFVFPSLHDSSGNAVLEALSFGLPVVCLDLGGPAQIVTRESGVVVAAAGRSTAQVAAAMGQEVVRLLARADALQDLSTGALARARQFESSSRVAQFYQSVEKLIERPQGVVAPAAA